MRKRSTIATLVACGVAALIAAAVFFFARMQLTRPTMRDAVFVKKIEKLMRKGEAHEAKNDAGTAGI